MIRLPLLVLTTVYFTTDWSTVAGHVTNRMKECSKCETRECYKQCYDQNNGGWDMSAVNDMEEMFQYYFRGSTRTKTTGGERDTRADRPDEGNSL